VLEQLPQGSELTLYRSAGEPSVPASIKSHARRVARLLERLVRRADGRLTFRSRDPRPDSDDELRALADGLRRVPMTSGDRFFLGATFRHGQRLGAIAYFDIRRDRQLEYDVAVVLNSLGKPKLANVGVLSPLLPSVAAYRDREGLTFVQELKRAYDLTVFPFFRQQLPPDLDVLIVLDASVLRHGMLYAIDQFVMAGGRLIVMMDPHVRFNRSSNQVRPQPYLLFCQPRASRIDDGEAKFVDREVRLETRRLDKGTHCPI
jgi:ABC-2 type transport system permease protein